jgi:hypothetical protein
MNTKELLNAIAELVTLVAMFAPLFLMLFL